MNYFDNNGNQTKLDHLAGVTWNFRDNIASATIIERTGNPNDVEYYIHDSSGQRTRKVKETWGSGKWFKARGVDIDKYTVVLDEGTHSAIHYGGGAGKGGGWWNETIMERLFKAEKDLGRQLTKREILAEGAKMRRQAGLQDAKIVPYK
ncbi:MAG: DUF2380 domain-containing protein [Deltaproteobacteria bacterium]|nr:DUF2380 domain-containing protein [Deltaproteobacteria bacterium]